MDKSRIEELAMAVAMVTYYQDIIDQAKDEIRGLTDEEVAKINEGNSLIITRQDYTKTTYSEEYKREVAKIAEKYPPTKEKFVNHTIKLQATGYTNSKRELITNNFATLNKTQLKAASKQANIK